MCGRKCEISTVTKSKYDVTHTNLGKHKRETVSKSVSRLPGVEN